MKQSRAARNLYLRNWMKKNPEKRREYALNYATKHPEKHRNQVNVRAKRRGRRVRERVIKKYGGKCRCCGVSDYQFLSFDHKKGEGLRHRLRLALHGQRLVTWLDGQKRRKDIQILCHNCNLSLGFYGFCPHRPNVRRKITRQ